MPAVVLTTIFWNVLLRAVDGYAALDMGASSRNLLGDWLRGEPLPQGLKPLLGRQDCCEG
jgi:hypothetical protein